MMDLRLRFLGDNGENAAYRPTRPKAPYPALIVDMGALFQTPFAHCVRIGEMVKFGQFLAARRDGWGYL